TLDVDLIDLGSGLFHPKLGDSFDLMMAESFTGDFDNFIFDGLGGGLYFSHSIVALSRDLEVYRLTVVEGEVPEPAALTLLPVGLVVTLAWRRRLGGRGPSRVTG